MRRPLLTPTQPLIVLSAALFIAIAAAGPEVIIKRRDLAAIDARVHQSIRNAGILIQDPVLEAHIANLIRRLTGTGSDMAPPYCIRIINTSELNAFSLSDGTIYIGLALFGMINNDAELAFLLSHEISHVKRDHHRRFKYELQKKTAGWFSGSGYHLRVALGGFSRTQEHHADSIAISMLMRQGFNAWRAKGFFATMYRWLAYKEKKHNKKTATHPTLKKRYQTIKKRLLTENIDTTAGITGEETYQKSLSAHQNQIVQLLLQSNCVNELYTLALDKLNNHKVYPEWFYLRGTLLQRYFAADSFAVAHASLSAALRKKPGLTEALRDLGWLYLKNNQADSARSCLSQYLITNPHAPDSSLILFYLEGLE